MGSDNLNRLTADLLKPQITSEQLEQYCSEHSDLTGFLGHDRAKEALKFGLSMHQTGYNLYVMGFDGSGKHTLIRELLEPIAKTQPTPDDWCYVNNFDQNSEPNTFRLDSSDAKVFRRRMSDLIDELIDTFPAALENPSYQRRRSAIDREFNQKYESALAQVEQQALKSQVALFEESGTINFAPIVNGKAIDDGSFAQLSDEQREQYYKAVNELEEVLTEALIELPQWKRESSEKSRILKTETIEQAVKPLLKQFEHEFHSDIRSLKYLREVKKHLPKAVLDILVEPALLEQRDDLEKRELLKEQFMPNPLVTHKIGSGAPIIYEDNPTYANLFGRMEYANVQGNYYTSYRYLKAGALHKANGGYLIVDAEKLLQQPYVWESLKLALKSRQLKIEQPFSDMGVVNTITLSPQEIPLDVKVIFVGPRNMYYLLQEYDHQFNELFRVLVDFDDDINCTPETMAHFVALMNSWAKKSALMPISYDAYCELITYSAREAEHAKKLSAHLHKTFELISEANMIATMQGAEQVLDTHIQQALKAKLMRTGRIPDEMIEQIHEGSLLISTEGAVSGKINALTVLQIGDSSFGSPSRITASVYAGSEGIVDIERESELGQAIHSKGVMLLTGYLGNKYAQDFPLAISANIAMEQSYGYIDGDSASLAELVCLISALTHIPLKQSLAVTGSINQHGEVQAIGGVNEKIEGFYRLCKERGLTKEQGVVIPAHNVPHLVLDAEVVSAVENGHFSIYAITNVDEALELLLGLTAGELDQHGKYAKDTIHGLAINRLKRFSELAGHDTDDDEKDDKDEKEEKEEGK
jgi:lon-related putative ATP-dependent protease